MPLPPPPSLCCRRHCLCATAAALSAPPPLPSQCRRRRRLRTTPVTVPLTPPPPSLYHHPCPCPARSGSPARPSCLRRPNTVIYPYTAGEGARCARYREIEHRNRNHQNHDQNTVVFTIPVVNPKDLCKGVLLALATLQLLASLSHPTTSPNRTAPILHDASLSFHRAFDPFNRHV